MDDQNSASAVAGAAEDLRPALPPGDYAIVEVLGHRTLIGRVGEVERFGTRLLAIEHLFAGQLLPAVLIGGSSIYQFTPVTAEVAARRQPTRHYQLPGSIAAIAPPLALPAPAEPDDDEPIDPEFTSISVDADDHEVEF